MKETSPLRMLVSALIEPSRCGALTPRAWNELLLAARAQGLLARLAHALADAGAFEAAPPKARAHLIAARIAADSTRTAVRFEINRILRAVDGLDVPIVLLKGAAYAHAGLPSARGRLIGDLDLMVPRVAIGAIEKALVTGGWIPSDMDDYDQHYYREWMHEIPPLQHPDRDTPVDIHHSITPSSGRFAVDGATLYAASLEMADRRLRVLAPADMVLHCAAHLFNTEVGKPLRDLFDLRDLLIHFSREAGFWSNLQARARLLGLERPLHYALRHARRLLDAPVPPGVELAAAAAAPAAPQQVLMDWLFGELLLPDTSQKFRAGAAL